MSLWILIGVVFAALYIAQFGLNKAFAEVEMEGDHGWAAKTASTYRVTTRAAKRYARAMGGKPLSSWNASEQLFFVNALVGFVIPWFLYATKSDNWWVIVEFIDYILLLLVGFMTWLGIYDFDWFLFHYKFNPGGKYTWNYKKLFEHAWWHKARVEREGALQGLPVDYPSAAAGVICLAILRSLIAWSLAPLYYALLFVVLVLVFTAIAYWLFLDRYQTWYIEAHRPENDERHLAIPEDCR